MRIGRSVQWILVTPLVFLLVATVLIPTAILFGYSLFAWRLVEPTGPVTLQNYVAVLTDPL